MSDKYTTETASIRATIGKFRKLDTDKLTIKGQDVSELISGGSGSVTIKHSQDTRETVTENDLWGQWVETLEDGTVIIHDDWITNPNWYAWNSSITKVEDNKAYVGDTFYGNIQTEKIKNGGDLFSWCNNLTSFAGDLSSMTNGNSMFEYCNNLTSFCGNSSDSPVNLSSLTQGSWMFYQTLLASFNGDLSSLTNGNYMFGECFELASFSSDLPSLTDARYMFNWCSKLTSFSSDLSSLMDGNSMFSNCSKLETFSSDLPSLTYGRSMFYNAHLTTFSSDLSSMTNGHYMFYSCENLTSFSSELPSLTKGNSMFSYCDALASFSSDLPSLTDGSDMFNSCSNLTKFTSDLASLTSGISMFSKCKLDAKSIMYIIHSIKDLSAEWQLYKSGSIPYVTVTNGVYSAQKGYMNDTKYVYTYNNPEPYTTTITGSSVGRLTIGIDVTNNSSTIDQQLQTFAEGTLFDSWADLKQAFVDKGWTVTWQYGGTSDSITYDLRGGERIIPCPVYTKLIEILPEGIEHDEDGNEVGDKFYTDEQKKLAQYCNEDGSKFYDIEWGHDVTHPEEFQQFDSLETACVSYGVMPKEYLETNGQTTLF